MCDGASPWDLPFQIPIYMFLLLFLFIYKEENFFLLHHWGLEISHVTLHSVLFLLCMPLLTFSTQTQDLILVP